MRSKYGFTSILAILVLILIAPFLFDTRANTKEIELSSELSEIELEFGVPTKLAVIETKKENPYTIDLYVTANFSNKNGTIWINDEGFIRWEASLDNYLEETIHHYVKCYITYSRYSLWANSSTLGTNKLLYDFSRKLKYGRDAGDLNYLFIIILISVIGISTYFIFKILRERDKS